MPPELSLTEEHAEHAIVRRQVRDTDTADVADECLLCGAGGRPLAWDHDCQPVLSDADADLGRQSPGELCAVLVERYVQGIRRRNPDPEQGPEVYHDPDDDRPEYLRVLFPRPKPRTPTPGGFATVNGYGARSGKPEARLAGVLRTLNAATEGERNARLHWAACRVGDMLAAGELADEGRATDALEAVALAIGLTPREVSGTIRSGLASGGVHA